MLVSLVVATALFAMLFRFLPDVRLRWRDVTTGAFVTAVLFTIGQQLIGLYLGQSSVASSYGAAGSVMILLLWVYYSCQILLLGAEFTRVYAQRIGQEAAAGVLRRKGSARVNRLFALAIFFSATLLFMVQPLAGRFCFPSSGAARRYGARAWSSSRPCCCWDTSTPMR